MSSQSDIEEFLTVADVAALLKINEQTVRNWIDRGELAAVRAGRRVRIRRSALDEVLTAVPSSKPPATEPVPEGPSGDDFWGGVAVGSADLAAPSPAQPAASPSPATPPSPSDTARPSDNAGPSDISSASESPGSQ